MRVVNVIQGSFQWLQARTVRVTASGVADVMAFLKRGDKKGGDTAARSAYKAQIVSEILTGQASGEGFINSYMERGTEQEPYARAAYEIRNDVSVDTVGFVIHPTIERFGASPDGLIGLDGGVELKNPKTSTHIDYMLAGILPVEYEPQVMSCLSCTERDWWDFVSFDSRLPLRHQMFKIRVFRNEERIKEIESGVLSFLQEVDDIIGRLNELNPEVEVADSIPFIEDGLGIQDADLPDWWRDSEQVSC